MQFITDSASLREAMKKLKDQKIIAVDTEFKRNTSYFPKTCLIQVAARAQEPIVIDVLAYNINLMPLLNLLEDEKITKIFHDVSQDIEAIYHSFGIIPNNIFDTQIASSLARVGSELSYSNLVFKLTGVNLNKELQYTDWERRPLSEKQLEYAAKDVEHLIAIYDKLYSVLDKFNRIEWHNALVKNNIPNKADESKKWYKMFNRFKSKSYNDVEVAIVYGLIKMREEYAKKNNVIREKILSADEIKLIKKMKPTTLKEVKKCKTRTFSLLNMDIFCRDVLDVVANAYEEDNDFVKLNKVRMSEEYKSLSSYIINNVNLKSKHLGVAPSLIARKEDIDSYIIDRITNNNPNLEFLEQFSFDKTAKKVLDNLCGEK